MIGKVWLAVDKPISIGVKVIKRLFIVIDGHSFVSAGGKLRSDETNFVKPD
ncbi:MAG: hypothetical protein ACOCUK_01315 [bacterium]